ncbi:MAG: PAS domain S-box protein [Ignavibacteriae bacterium]|nr:PAS domain S-box protein [Ignavibacteriota bacterium]
MNLKNTLNYSYFDLDIINKFETLEEFPNTKPILLSNSNGLILYANNTGRIKHNFKAGHNLFDLFSEPDLQTLFGNLIQNKISSFCTDLILKDDNDYYEGYLLNLERVILNDEEIFIVFIDSQDNRTRLTSRVNNYNQALEAVNVGVMLADKNGCIHYLSTSFEQFLRIKIEDVYSKKISKAFQKHLSSQELESLQTAIELKKNWVKVTSDIASEGEIIYKEIRLSAVKDNIDKSYSYIITANDITEHIEQARLLKRSEQRQKSIINNISDPILIIRKEKNNLIFENANESFYKNILARKNEIKSEFNLQEIVSPEFFKIINNEISNLISKERVHAQFHYTAISNKRYLGKITFTDDSYDLTRLFIINLTDITEQLEIERKLRDAYNKEINLNKLKSTFLANMSHEIRTPLNAIVGYSDLLEDDVKAKNYESSSQMTGYLKEGVSRLLKLVDNIVEVSLLDSGNEEIVLAPMEINKIIKSNKDVWQELAKSKKLQLVYNLSPEEITIVACEEKLDRAVKEIMDNAIKYSLEKGRIIISTSVNKDKGCIEIIDDGIGIENSSMEKIFHLFEQVEESGYTRSYEGAGLGLSLANKLISYMNGELKIASTINKGTTVKVLLPQN